MAVIGDALSSVRSPWAGTYGAAGWPITPTAAGDAGRRPVSRFSGLNTARTAL